jgi:hypothetical protein
MRRRKNLHTRFIQFLMESEKSNLNQFKDETEIEEVEKNGDEIMDDEIMDDEKEDVDADEVIERLVLKLKKTNKEFDDIIQGRK